MLKRSKHGNWVILEDTETGQKTFALPNSKTELITNWSWSETTDEKQTPAAAPQPAPQ